MIGSIFITFENERRNNILIQFKTRQWLAAVMVIAMYLSGCGTKGDNQKIASSTAPTDSIPVQVAAAQIKDLSVEKIYSGTLEGKEQANIVAKISERVTQINVHVGDAALTGQALVLLDKTGPSSQYYQAEANYRNAETNLGRIRSLYEEGAVSQQSLDGAQTAYDIAKANFDAARNSVELTTPISGVVTAVNVNVGDLTTPGAVLVTVANVSQMKVIFNVGEFDIPNFSLGQRTRIYSEFRRDLIMEGQISQLAKSADVRSRSFEIKALFSNSPDRWFKPGMFCKAEVDLSSRKGSLVIPNAAIMNDGTQYRVFLIKNGRAYRRNVQPGISDGTLIEILDGLQKGDIVATVGLNNLRDSSLIVITNHDVLSAQ
jgi:membrane fusion protein, multidrug efflux system